MGMNKTLKFKETPNSRRPSDLLLKAAQDPFGQNSNCLLNVFLKTFGCQMNEYDSELVRSILERCKYVFVEDERDADVILLNTCSVRQTAERKVLGHVDLLRHELKGKPVLIGILGCMATAQKNLLLDNCKRPVDFICGPDSYRRLPDIISQAFRKQKICDIRLSKNENYNSIYPKRQKGINAWVAISRGCDNFCTFCIVPLARGRERSREPKNIMNEIKALSYEGFPQVTLLGQNVNSYQSNNYDFPKLLTKVSQIKGIKRVRFMSPHPKDFPDDLIQVIAKTPNICKHIHLPLQSGSSRILKLMNRTYTKTKFLSLIKKIRTAIPHIALTTDIIVGFPTETEEDFFDTLEVIQATHFDAAFIFKYSPRIGTAAQRRFPDDVSAAVKTHRIIRLNEIQRKISLEKNQEYINRYETILVENLDSKGFCRGRTDSNKMVSVKAPFNIGDFLKVRICSASSFGLSGQLAN